MDERRQFPRFKIGVEVTWKKISSAEKTALHISAAKDISTAGVCIVLHPGIEVGDVLQIDIAPKGQAPITLNCKVVWVTQEAHVPGRKDLVCEGGVQFLSADITDKKNIDRLITNSLMTQPHK